MSTKKLNKLVGPLQETGGDEPPDGNPGGGSGGT